MDAVTRDLECTNLLSGPFSQKALSLSLSFLSLSLSLYFHWPGEMLDAVTRDLESTNLLSGPFSPLCFADPLKQHCRSQNSSHKFK